MIRDRLEGWAEVAALRIDVPRLMRQFDTDAFRAIQAKHEHDDPWPGYSKYLQPEEWLVDKIRKARRHLALHRSRGLRVLDIGTGTGYFPWICQQLGHQARGLDIDEVPLFAALIDYLGIEREVFEIKPFRLLPDLGQRFDVITAFMICFNGHNSPDLWGVDEWRFFLDDLDKNQLAAGGRALLSFNDERDGRFYTDELAAFFRSRGARIEGRDVLLGAPPHNGLGLGARLLRRAGHLLDG